MKRFWKIFLTCPNYMSSIRQGFQARILLFSSLARSLRYINLTDFELLPICYKSVFVVNIYKFLYTNILFLCIFYIKIFVYNMLYTNQGIASKEVCVSRGFIVSRLSALHRPAVTGIHNYFDSINFLLWTIFKLTAKISSFTSEDQKFGLF